MMQLVSCTISTTCHEVIVAIFFSRASNWNIFVWLQMTKLVIVFSVSDFAFEVVLSALLIPSLTTASGEVKVCCQLLLWSLS